jgi:hypothetical protein
LDYFDYLVYQPLNISEQYDYPFMPQGNPTNGPALINLGSMYDYAQATTPGRCNDQRDTIIQEYVTFQVGVIPTCSAFTQTASTAHFTFNELN